MQTGEHMEILIWIGAAVSLMGVAGLGYCVALALRARKSGLTDDENRKNLQKIVTYNTAALGVSALGLMLVVVGIVLS
jgi:alkylhydroperoxidase/carboxymuconolactone decarboxylase family protein YurZ